MFVKYRITLLMVSLLLACIVTANLYSQSNKSTSGYFDPDYYSIKAYFLNEIQSQKYKSSETNNWMYRWLWNNKFNIDKNGNLSYLSQDISGFTSASDKSGNDRLLTQSGWVPVGPIKIPPYI